MNNTVNDFVNDVDLIIPFITNGTNVPWSPTEAFLQEFFYEGRSGQKLLNPLMQRIYNDDNPQDFQPVVQNNLEMMYGDKWRRLWEALNLEYAPIDNYNMIEESEDVKNGNSEGTDTGHTHSVTDGGTTLDTTDTLTHVKDATKIMTVTDTDTNRTIVDQDDISGYNQSGYSPSEKHTHTYNGPHTQTTQGADDYEDTRVIDTDTTVDDDITVDSSTSRKNTYQDNLKHVMTRKGNIGVTTSQQMLESEIVLRNKYTFWEIVFTDLDRFLTLPIY